MFGKLKVSNKARDYYRVGVLKSGIHTDVLKEINSTCECFSKEVTLKEFKVYFEIFRIGDPIQLIKWHPRLVFQELSFLFRHYLTSSELYLAQKSHSLS